MYSFSERTCDLHFLVHGVTTECGAGSVAFSVPSIGTSALSDERATILLFDHGRLLKRP